MTQKKEQKLDDSIKFEDAFKELEKLVETLETGDISLEDSLALYEKGMTFVKWCTDQLNQAELRLEELANNAMGEFESGSVEEEV